MSELSDENIRAISDTLLKDPKSRKMVLKLISEHKAKIEEYIQEEQEKKSKNKFQSPVRSNTKTTPTFESPVAMFRRMLLNKPKLQSNDESCDKSPLMKAKPFNEILQGVGIYVIIVVEDVNRSHYAKLLMEKMGAQVYDSITSKVTHVMFMGGQYEAYRRATLLKLKLVSILWLDASRKISAKADESKYPAIDFNVSEEEKVAVLEKIEQDLKNGGNLEKPIVNNINQNTSNRLTSYATPSRKSRAHNNELKDSNLHSNFVTIRKNPSTSRRQTMFSQSTCFQNSSSKSSQKNPQCLPLQSESTNSETMSSLRLSDNSSKDSDKIDVISQSPISQKILKPMRVSASEKKSILKQNSTRTDLASCTNINATSKTSSKELMRSLLDKYLPRESISKTEVPLNHVTVRKRFKRDDISNDSKRRKTMAPIVTQISETSSSGSEKLSPLHISSKESVNSSRFVISKEDKISDSIAQMNNLKLSSNVSDRSLSNNKYSAGSSIDMSPLYLSESASDQVNSLHESSNTNPDKLAAVVEIECAKTSNNTQKTENVTRSISSFKPSDESLSQRKRISRNISGPSLLKNTPDKVTIASNRFTIGSSGFSAPKSVGKNNSARKSRRLSKLVVTTSSKVDNDEEDSKKIVKDNAKKDEHVFKKPNIDNPMKPLRRKLFDLNDPIDEFNVDYDKEYEKFDKSVSNVNKKKLDATHFSPICLTDKSSHLTATSSTSECNVTTKKDCTYKKNINLTNRNIIKKTQTKILSAKHCNSNQKFVKHFDLKFQSEVLKRRSTSEFQLISKEVPKIKKPKQKPKYITCTYFPKEDVKEFEKIVKTLGGFEIEANVSPKTTHLIVGDCTRTINILRAIARGCWILKKQWLNDSMENYKWLSEEEYELTAFSAAVQQCRLRKQAFGSFTMDIFLNCGPIFISRGSKPNHLLLEELVTLCKGKTVATSRRASILIGEYVNDENTICVTENWVLDSITHNKKKSYKKYLIEPESSPVL